MRGPTFALVVLLGACTEGPSARASETDLAAARAAVVDVFTAVQANDCAALRTLMPRIDSEAACAEEIGEWREHGLDRFEILSVEQDGRDPSAFIVRTRLMQQGGRERQLMVRTLRDGDRWRVML